MRVSPCGFAASSVEEAISLARTVTAVTHNHPEGIKAAEAVSVAIYMARNGKSLLEIRDYIKEKGYTLTPNTYIEKTPAPPIDPKKVREEFKAILQEVEENEAALLALLKEGGYIDG